MNSITIKKAHREPGEKPAETTEDESLNKSDDIEKSPALHSNTVAGEEYRDGAVESHGESEDQEPSSVPQPDTVVDVGTVVIKLSHTPVTDSAVLGPQRSDGAAGVAQPQYVRAQVAVS